MDADINKNNFYSPGRYFYGPDLYTIYNFTVSISGAPLSIGGPVQSTGKTTETVEIEDPLEEIGNPISPWTDDENISARIVTDDIVSPPVLNQRFDPPAIGTLKFDMDYSFSPTGSSEMQFMPASKDNAWTSYDKVNWNDVQSVLTSFSGRGDLNFNLNHSGGLFTNKVTFSGSGTWRDYTYLNEEAEKFLDSSGITDQKEVAKARQQIYGQTSYTTSHAYTGTLRPLYQNPIFRQSSIQYGFRGTLVRSKRYDAATSPDGPQLSPHWGSWVKEKTKDGELIPGLTNHRLSANLSASVFDKQQSLTVSTDLPPLDPLVESNLTLRFWISETVFNMRMDKPEGSDVWIRRPYNITETLRFHARSNFRYYMVVDPESNHDITTINSTLTLWGFSASFRAEKATKYKFEFEDYITRTGGRWVPQEGEPKLIPRELAFSFIHTFSKIKLKERVDFSADVRTNLNFDLQRQTNSNFAFSMGFNFVIPGFMDVRIAARSVNNVVFRYFKGISAFDHLTVMYPSGPQNNLFTDLLDSFNFFDDSKRRRSGFKMSDLELTATHLLGDWKAVFEMRVYPYQSETLTNAGTTIPKWEFTADFSIYVQWSPISEIKTEMNYKGETNSWHR
jgi:hypothetical protein